MANINDYLNFFYSSHENNSEISKNLSYLLETRIAKLENITKSIELSSFVNPSLATIPLVYNKFKKNKNSEKYEFTPRELKTLTYGLTYSENSQGAIFTDSEELFTVLKLFNDSWRDYYLYGLIDCLLQNWNNFHSMSKSMLSDFVMESLEKYDGNRKILQSFKNNKRYFDINNNGDLTLGAELAIKKIPIVDVTSYLGVPAIWLMYNYFSNVIITYFEKLKLSSAGELGTIDNLLPVHNNKDTNKKLLSRLIIKANTAQFHHLKDSVKKLAFNFIGDPSLKSKWYLENSSQSDVKILEDARIILNEWITSEFINVFFKHVINEPRRKTFWLKYSSKISSFKVYGPHSVKRRLKQVASITDFVDARFESVRSSKDVSAIIMYIKDYMLIEFSDKGYAFYAYKINSKHIPNLDYGLNSVDQLRTYPYQLISRTGNIINNTNQEGKLNHSDGHLSWEEVFSYWLQNIGDIDV